jgi:hypothetical protein
MYLRLATGTVTRSQCALPLDRGRLAPARFRRAFFPPPFHCRPKAQELAW